MAEEIDPELIARRLDRVLDELAAQRDDVIVVTARVERLDATVGSLVVEDAEPPRAPGAAGPAARRRRVAQGGKFVPPTRERKPRATSPRAPRGTREELKAKIVELVRQRPEGLIAAQINDALNATELREKQQIANLLALLKKEGVLRQVARRGPYFAPQKGDESPGRSEEERPVE